MSACFGDSHDLESRGTNLHKTDKNVILLLFYAIFPNVSILLGTFFWNTGWYFNDSWKYLTSL